MQLANFCSSVRFSGLNTMVPSCPLYQDRTATPNHMPQFQKTDRSIAQLTELLPPCRETHAFYPCQCRAETGHRSGFHMGIPKTCWAYSCTRRRVKASPPRFPRKKWRRCATLRRLQHFVLGFRLLRWNSRECRISCRGWCYFKIKCRFPI